MLRFCTKIWLFPAAFILFFSLQLFGQDEEGPDLKPLLHRWLTNRALPEGLISLITFKKPTKFDKPDDNANVSFLDLNRKGPKELAVQSYCAPVGNCDLDLYERVGKSYREILKTQIVQTNRPLATKTHGYSDLELRTHDSAFKSYHRIFKFDGARYGRSSC
jgi:hypothetical protein